MGFEPPPAEWCLMLTSAPRHQHRLSLTPLLTLTCCRDPAARPGSAGRRGAAAAGGAAGHGAADGEEKALGPGSRMLAEMRKQVRCARCARCMRSARCALWPRLPPHIISQPTRHCYRHRHPPTHPAPTPLPALSSLTCFPNQRVAALALLLSCLHAPPQSKAASWQQGRERQGRGPCKEKRRWRQGRGQLLSVYFLFAERGSCAPMHGRPRSQQPTNQLSRAPVHVQGRPVTPWMERMAKSMDDAAAEQEVRRAPALLHCAC